MQAKDYYELLGVSRRASQATLRHAFRTRMLDLHPDLHPDDALACQHTREILDAYETLGNPASRRAYDKDLAELEAEELNWRYVGTEECAPLTRQVLLFILAALAIVALIWAVRAVLDSRSPVYRFQLTELWADNQPTHTAKLLDPQIWRGIEWYQATTYQTISSPVVAQETTTFYGDALKSAERCGDRAAAEFYRSSLREIERARMSAIPLGNNDDPQATAIPPGNVPGSGAKRPVESS